MNKKFLFMTMLTSLLMSACSQDEPNQKGEDKGEATTSYMAVNLVSSDESISRAQTGYEDGTTAENQITEVRFYFFNAAGGPVNVKLLDNEYVNFYDWTPESQSPDTNQDDDVEKKLPATIVINTKDGDKVPQMIVAVLNPTSALKAKKSQSLSSLESFAEDYADSDLTKLGKFVMFNSVYRKDGQKVCPVHITQANLAKSKEFAIANPVTLYVERSVAKVSMGVSIATDYDSEKKLLKLRNKKKEDGSLGDYITVDGKQVYLKLNSWSLTGETNSGRLVKKINPAWEMAWVQSATNPYRSCWAINDMNATNDYYSHGERIADGFGSDHYLYTNENAQLTDIDSTPGKAQNRTKVKIEAQLCDESGNPMTVVRHLGVLFLDTYVKPADQKAGHTPAEEMTNLPKLKESILSQLMGNKKYYYAVTTVEGKKIYTQISKEDLKIETVEQDPKEHKKAVNCYVYAQLTDAAKSKTWCVTSSEISKDPETPVPTATADAINADLANKGIVDQALAWPEGNNYYFFEILHNGSQAGVVRNHVYKTTVTGITGLGTPVYDPSIKVYPEKPESNDHYVAAEIMILSWHVVTNNYELEW